MKEKSYLIEKIGLWLLYLSVTLEIIIVIIDKSNYTNRSEERRVGKECRL